MVFGDLAVIAGCGRELGGDGRLALSTDASRPARAARELDEPAAGLHCGRPRKAAI